MIQAQQNVSFFGYCLKYDFSKDKNTLLAQYNPINPFEKLSIGLVGRPSRRLHVFTELKTDQTNNIDTSVGFRAKFSGGMLTGTIGMNGKATSVYKH